MDDGLYSAIRQNANVAPLDDVEEVLVEANGQISVILKEHKQSQRL